MGRVAVCGVDVNVLNLLHAETKFMHTLQAHGVILPSMRRPEGIWVAKEGVRKAADQFCGINHV